MSDEIIAFLTSQVCKKIWLSFINVNSIRKTTFCLLYFRPNYTILINSDVES